MRGGVWKGEEGDITSWYSREHCVTVDVTVVCRDLKQVLSLVEKLQSHTSATRNQWAEASQLCHSMLPQLTDRLSHTHTRMDTHAERVATITEQNMDT